MALLTCALCEQPVQTPIPSNEQVFCCHGCKQLYELLGEEQVRLLKSQPGIDWANLRNLPASESTRSMITAGNAQEIQLALSGVWCPSCCILIQQVLKRQPGVVQVKIDFAQATADVLYDADQIGDLQIAKEIKKLGYDASKKTDQTAADSDAVAQLRQRLAVAGIFTFFMMMLSIPVWSGYLPLFPGPIADTLSWGLFALATPVVFWSGWPFLRGAWTSLTRRVPTMDLLVSIGSLSAFFYSFFSLFLGDRYLYFDTSGLLITFLLLSRVLEAGTRQKAMAVLSLAQRLIPQEARRKVGDAEELVSVDALSEHDSIVIRSGDVIPIDGRVLAGDGEVDEAILTGESVRATKGLRDLVYAGTTYFGQMLLVEVLRSGETLLSQTVGYVRKVQESDSGWKRLADRILVVFVPIVLSIGVLTFAWSWWGLHVNLASALLRAVAVLVIGCPCALSIATPVALIGGAQALSQKGVLLRSTDAFERATRISTVVFDKTGTLTTGRMALEAYWPQTAAASTGPSAFLTDPDSWLALAASAEYPADHPIADALIRFAQREGYPQSPVEAFAAESGWGVRARIRDREVAVGSTPLCAAIDPAWQEQVTDWQAKGWTTAYVLIDDMVAGILAFTSEIRAEAADVVQTLQSRGIQVWLTSGDHEQAVSQVATAVHITDWLARQNPLDKAELIRTCKAKGQRVCFIGDGINDAAALVEANLGVAMGSSADIALEAGHMILAQNQLATIPYILDTVRLTSRVVKQNLVWALGYNVIAQFFAVQGLASPVLAAIAMVLSSVFVLGNSLRVVGFSPWQYVGRLSWALLALLALIALAYYRI